jgi:hypothetical protein
VIGPFLAGSDSNVLRREVEEERAKSSRLERQVEFLEGALDHERQRNERSEAVSMLIPDGLCKSTLESVSC